MANPYSIGRNCRITFLWNGIRVDLRDVTSFQANQETSMQRADPLNTTPVEFNTPNGWRGTFVLARANATLSKLVADIESGFWNGSQINNGTIYQYITEPDGTTTTWQFSNVSFTFNEDAWAASGIVHQTCQFFASTRTKIS